MRPSISVIVPIYNVEKFLKRCVDSLLSQTLQNIEIILVNDGSTDGCGRLAEQCLELDPRIKVIHKGNGGLSSARNTGLEIASGEYVSFIDSDDWVSTEMCEKMYRSAVQHDADIVMTGFYRVSEDGAQNENPLALQQEVYKGDQILQEILIPMLGAGPTDKDDICIEMCVWRNLYRRQLIEDGHFRFVSERKYISEDILFNLDVFRKAGTVSIVKDSLYFYSINPQSLTQVYRSDRFQKECILFSYLIRKLKEIGLYDKSDQRVKRAFIGRARKCIINEARDNRMEGTLKRIRNIKCITQNDLLSECIREYPIQHYTLKQRLVAYCMKYQLATLLFLATANHQRH